MHTNRRHAMATTLITDWRELAERSVDGLDVRLWWSRSTDRVQLTVADHRGGDHVVADVDGADALDAFRHPFAYADRRGRSQRPQPRRDLSLVHGREQQ
jgi:hypothetical protein